jgi:competence protein ComEA
MANEHHLLGITAAPPPSPVLLSDAKSPQPPTWPVAAQWCMAGLLAVGLALVAWRGWGLSSYSTRPLPIERTVSLDVNQADEIDLQQIPGVGPDLAKRIVQARPFGTIEELRRVSGIGPKTLENLQRYFHVARSYQEEDPPPRIVRARADDPPVTKGKKKLPETPIDVNRATLLQLQQLPGIGPTLATRIIDARAERPFTRVDDLRRVKGIGPKTLEKLRPHVIAREEN